MAAIHLENIDFLPSSDSQNKLDKTQAGLEM